MWDVVLVEEVNDWYMRLDEKTTDLVSSAIDLLEQSGPVLGRPMVDTVKGSTFSNMKELRPGSSGGSEVRILFAFDAQRQAVLLVAGDKSGKWKQWYDDAIPVADKRFAKWKGKG